MCNQKEMKYKCPGCFKLTCGLKCLKDHKEQFSCDGKKKEVACHKELRKMDDMTLGLLKKDINFIGKGI
jgi:hypothetical protein